MLCDNYNMLSPLSVLLDILFPENCLGCGRSGGWLCEPCIGRLPQAIDNQPSMRGLFDYEDKRIRAAIHKLKYKRGLRLASTLGVHLAEFVLEDLSELALFENMADAIIVPTPLSRERLRERGFNQSELLAEVVSGITGLPLSTEVLAKTKHTAPQVSLKDRRSRQNNLSGAFTIIQPEIIKNKSVILIDDVYTTGATASEIMKTLGAAGARYCITYTIAH